MESIKIKENKSVGDLENGQSFLAFHVLKFWWEILFEFERKWKRQESLEELMGPVLEG